MFILHLIFFQRLAEITGARAFERYTGTQIMKISQNNTDAYNDTEVSLSSWD